MNERSEWLQLCGSIYDHRRVSISKTSRYFGLLSIIAYRHGSRDGGTPDKTRTDRPYYMALCEMFYDGTISADELATLEYIWWWIEARKPEPEQIEARREMTEAEKMESMRRDMDRFYRDSKVRGD